METVPSFAHLLPVFSAACAIEGIDVNAKISTIVVKALFLMIDTISTRDHLHKSFHDNKLLCTTVGETFADYLNTTLGFGLNGTTGFTLALLTVALVFQFRSKTYKPVLYWLVVVLIPITETLFTFALGTATGNLVAERFDLGYAVSFFIFAGIIAVVSLLWKRNAINHVFAFWTVHVFTRPLDASIGDQMSQNDPTYGGWGLGTTKTSIIFLSAIAIMVVYLVRSKRDQGNFSKDL